MKSHQPRYAIRKYAVGAASVLIGFFAGANVVAADTPTAIRQPFNDSSNSAKRE